MKKVNLLRFFTREKIFSDSIMWVVGVKIDCTNSLTVCANTLIYKTFLVPQFNVSPTYPRLQTFLLHSGTEPSHLFILISHSASFLNLIMFGISGQPWGAEGEWRCCSTQDICSYSKSQLLFLVSQLMLPKKLSCSI